MPEPAIIDSLRSLNSSDGTRRNKELPAAKSAPAIPDRVGAADHLTQSSASSGGVDMTLRGAKTVTSTDGLITIFYPESAEVVVGATTITIPAIIKTP